MSAGRRGRSPYCQDGLVVCLLRGGFSRVEQTPLDGGRGAAVIQQRVEFKELMRERLEEVITKDGARLFVSVDVELEILETCQFVCGVALLRYRLAGRTTAGTTRSERD